MSIALRKCQVCRQAEWSGDQIDATETVGGPTRDRHGPTVPLGVRSRGVLSYPEMRQEEEVNLQQGINSDVRGGAVILMTRSALASVGRVVSTEAQSFGSTFAHLR